MGRKRKSGERSPYAYNVVERVGAVSLYKRKKSYYLYYCDQGKPKRIAVGRNLNAARRVAGEVNAEVQSGRPTPFTFDRIEVPRLIKTWLSHCFKVKRVSLQTLQRYRAAVSHFRSFLSKEAVAQFADQVTPELMDRFVTYLRSIERTRNGSKTKPGTNPLRRYSDSGIKFVLSTCRTLFEYALEKQHIPSHSGNPCRKLPFDAFNGHQARALQPFSQEQEAKFYKACDDWQLGIFFTLGAAGLRRDELRHMLISDIDWERRVVHICTKPELYWSTKTKVDREIPIFDQWEAILRRLVGSRKEGFVFLHRPYVLGHRELKQPYGSYKEMSDALKARLAEDQQQRKPMDEEESIKADMKIVRKFLGSLGQVPPNRIRQEFMKLTREIDLPEHTRAHEMRHLFATSMMEAGTDPFLRRDVLGHKSLEMTGRYTHTATAAKRREIEKMLNSKPEVAEVMKERLGQQGQEPG